jgi:hypothetical protein
MMQKNGPMIQKTAPIINMKMPTIIIQIRTKSRHNPHNHPIMHPGRHPIPQNKQPIKPPIDPQIRPNGYIIYRTDRQPQSRQDSGGGKTAIENMNIKNAGIVIDTQTIGIASPNNAKAKQMPTPTNDRGNIKPQIKHGRTGKLQQVKNPMQSPVQNSNPRQTRDAMPPRPRTVISATPASKTQVVTPQIKNDPAVMIDKNKNRIRIKRKNKAGNTIQSSMNASNPTMIYLLF